MLRLTTKGRYAVRILVRLALSDTTAPVRKQAISQVEGIPADYVEQILTKLRIAGLVVSRRGLKGGFGLARDSKDINVMQVLEAAEGPLSLAPCLDDGGCGRISSCVTRPLWQRANDLLKDFFSAQTIAQLAGEARKLPEGKTLTFHI